MSERGDYEDGEFCWVDLATPDLDASARFYGELMEWEFEPGEVPEGVDVGGYGNFTYRGKPVAGMGRIMQEGQPPAWSSYVKTSDADATAAKVKEAGGTVLMGPMDIPGGAGRMTVCQDAEGAFISHWQPGSHHGAELVNEVGAWTWNNLMSRDPDAAAEFYGAVFGWTRAQPEGAPDFIWNWQLDGQRWPEGLAGLMAMGGDMPADAPPYWQVYLAVEKLDEAIKKTNGAGGRVVFGPQDVPVGRFATVFDPQGAVVSLMEPDYPEAR
jgi:predicted enzyme related to lactoylglutathione lyase